MVQKAARGAVDVAQRATDCDAGDHRRSSSRFGLRDLEPEPETTMTDESMALIELIELIEKQADSDFLRDMLAFAADRIMAMEMEMEARSGAAKGTRSPLRAVQRNGYRDRDWDTRAGRITPAIPKLRPRRPAARPACGDRMIRLPTDPGQRLPELPRAASNGRAGLGGGDPGGLRSWHLDALERRSGQAPSRACWPCLRWRSDRRPAGLSPPGPAGSVPFGNRIEGLLAFRPRGLLAFDGVTLVIADDHKGLRAAARRVFDATDQRWRIHWTKNALPHAPAKQRAAVAAMLKPNFAQKTKADSEAR